MVTYFLENRNDPNTTPSFPMVIISTIVASQKPSPCLVRHLAYSSSLLCLFPFSVHAIAWFSCSSSLICVRPLAVDFIRPFVSFSCRLALVAYEVFISGGSAPSGSVHNYPISVSFSYFPYPTIHTGPIRNEYFFGSSLQQNAPNLRVSHIIEGSKMRKEMKDISPMIKY